MELEALTKNRNLGQFAMEKTENVVNFTLNHPMYSITHIFFINYFVFVHSTHHYNNKVNTFTLLELYNVNLPLYKSVISIPP